MVSKTRSTQVKLHKNLYDLPPEEEAKIPTVAHSQKWR
jgi:hypothetical protein